MNTHTHTHMVYEYYTFVFTSLYRRDEMKKEIKKKHSHVFVFNTIDESWQRRTPFLIAV